jgi:hypothetical protein
VPAWCQVLDENGCFDRKNELEILLPLPEHHQMRNGEEFKYDSFEIIQLIYNQVFNF